MTVLVILNFLMFLYIVYIAVQHFGNKRHVMWRGLIYAIILYIFTLSYILDKNIPGVVLSGLFYYLAITDLRHKEEQNGA